MSAEEQHQEPPIHQLHAGTTSPLVPKEVPCGAVQQIPEDPAQAALYKLLGARLRCTLSDGRIATGTFICMDRLKNMILMNVVEERDIDPSDYDPTNTTPQRVPVQRELSQAMIPGKRLVKVEMEKELFRQKMQN